MRKKEGKKSDMPERTQPKSIVHSNNQSLNASLPDIEASNLHLFFSQPENILEGNKFDSILSTVIKNIISLMPAKSGFIIKLGEGSDEDKIILVNSNGREYIFSSKHINVEALFNKSESVKQHNSN
jgi:hypothetical protein